MIGSFYNAIDRHEYARAYSYWEPGAADLPAYDVFVQGYQTTQAVQVGYGLVSGDAGAGQRYFRVPVQLNATTTGGSQYFVGCYTLHLGSPAIQTEPPFRPLAISAASIKASASPPTGAALEQACPQNGAPQPTAAPRTDAIDKTVYLDNRSDPASVLRSFYNAINRQEYARAYGYWQDQSTLPPFASFTAGYSTTLAVTLQTGQVQSDAGAGQRNYRVPVLITAQQQDGSAQTFAGCYSLHLALPDAQEPPFRPLGISAAQIKATDTSTLPQC